jgi:hypothetical protein
MTFANCDLCRKKAEYIARKQPYPDLTRRFFGSYAGCYGHEATRKYLDSIIRDLRAEGQDAEPFFAEA